MILLFLFVSFICRKFDYVALDACGAYSSFASLKKIFSLEKTQINLEFCSLIRIFAAE